MEQKVQLKYFNARLQIGMVDWKTVFLLYPHPVLLAPEVDKGRLIYRAKGSSKPYSYAQVKKGLTYSSKWFLMEVPSWL